MNIIPINILELIILVMMILPLFYRVILWLYIWQLKEYSLSKLKDFLGSLEGKYLFFSKYFIFEIFIIVIFFVFNVIAPDNNIYEYFAYILFIYVLLLLLYDILKISTKNATYPRFTIKIYILISILFILYLSYFWYILSYIDINKPLFFILAFLTDKFVVSATIILINPVFSFIKNIKVKQAKDKIYHIKELTTIGIAGSYGKTTTKMFIYQILSDFIKVQITPKYTTNEITITNFILNELKKDTQVLIVEIQSYKKGQIAEISNIIKNQIAVLTGIDEQHYNIFGNIENIIKSQSELLYTLPVGGRAYVNIDNDYISYLNIPNHISTVTYGINRESIAKMIITEMNENGSTFHFNYKDIDIDINTNIFGIQNISDLLPAIAIAIDMNIPTDKILSKLKNIELPSSTYQLTKLDTTIILDDTSSSTTPAGVMQAILNMDYIKKPKKILVLDDILELGEKAKDINTKLASIISNSDFLYVILVGKNYKYFLQEQILLINKLNKNQVLLEDDYEKIIKILTESKDCVILFEGINTKKFKDLIINSNEKNRD